MAQTNRTRVIMDIGGDYPRPILVNGYSCRNCEDVSNAKKFIDPAEAGTIAPAKSAEPAVLFGGGLSALNTPVAERADSGEAACGAGRLFDVCC